jgi:hypothetical protein
MIASAIHPLIYGSDGQGGVAGIFHGMFGGGKQGPVKVSTDLNTAATMQNSAAVVTLTAVLAGFMGIGAPAIAAPSIPGISSLSVPSISTPVHAGDAFSPLSLTLGSAGGYSPASSSAVPTGGYSPAQWASTGGYSPAPWASGGGTNPLAVILRGDSSTQGGTAGANSLFSKGGFSQTLSNLCKPDRLRWAACVLSQLLPITNAGDSIIMLAGNRYREALEPALRAHQ